MIGSGTWWSATHVVWHLLVVAEDRCSAEYFPRLRRKLQEKHAVRRSFLLDWRPD